MARRQQPLLPRRRHSSIPTFKKRYRFIILLLALIALLPPLFFHFRLRRFNQARLRKCGWLSNPPLVCAHGGDSTHAFPNTMAAYEHALRSQVDCIEIDVSRSLDGVLFALHDRELQRISKNKTTKVGYLSMKEIKELRINNESQQLHDQTIPTIEEALKLVSSSVRHVILDAKVGPPLNEKGLAEDILSIILVKTGSDACLLSQKEPKKFYFTGKVGKAQCKNCLVWAKSDSLARDVIKLKPDIPVGYIVMVDPSTGTRTRLLRMKGAGVVGVYYPLIDEKLVRILHGKKKKVYAWTVDDSDSLEKVLSKNVDAIVTNNPNLLQRLMHDIKTQCKVEGFSLL